MFCSWFTARKPWPQLFYIKQGERNFAADVELGGFLALTCEMIIWILLPLGGFA